IAADSLNKRSQREPVAADILAALAHGLSSVAKRDGNGSCLLAGLNKDRQFHLAAVSFDGDNVALTQTKFLGQLGRNRSKISPGNFADRLRQLLEPGIVGMASVAHRDALIKVNFIAIIVASANRLLVLIHNVLGGGLKVAKEAGCGSGRCWR